MLAASGITLTATPAVAVTEKEAVTEPVIPAKNNREEDADEYCCQPLRR
jgi:hypothetical protein